MFSTNSLACADITIVCRHWCITAFTTITINQILCQDIFGSGWNNLGGKCPRNHTILQILNQSCLCPNVMHANLNILTIFNKNVMHHGLSIYLKHAHNILVQFILFFNISKCIHFPTLGTYNCLHVDIYLYTI